MLKSYLLAGALIATLSGAALAEQMNWYDRRYGPLDHGNDRLAAAISNDASA